MDFSFLSGELVAKIVAFSIAGSALLSALVPSITKSSVWNVIMKIVDFIGGNFGKAKNAVEPPSEPE